MTYKELLDFLKTLPKERLEDDVTVRVQDDEYFPVTAADTASAENGVLDPGHAFLNMAYEKEYIVELYELHSQKYTVSASSIEGACDAAMSGEGDALGDPEFIETADKYHGIHDGSDLPDGVRSVEEE
jgi:hypothetical protein